MPCFRGIDISVITESVPKNLPEYPHPDGASVRLRKPHEKHDQNMLRQEPSLSSIESGRSSIQPQKLNPRVSVYIPSLPGVKFWLEYAIGRPPSPSCQLFFKMYMNGSHTTSWGINPRVKTKGTITRALFEPSDRWHYKEDGVILKRDGIESRSFHFASDPEERSVAEEGGTIEIQVFRSHGRRRRAAKLDQFRNQEKYGITAPSGGLLDAPEDATFYDFHLIDAKDSPYATFRFHYRSWKNLRQLSLIPSEVCIVNLEKSNTIAEDEETVQNASPVEDLIETQSIDSLIVDRVSIEKDCHDGEQESRNPYTLNSTPELRPVSPLNEYIPQPSKALRDCPLDTYLQRPLPELPRVPDTEPSLARSRKLSTDSRAPSITPSLLPFVNDELFMDESVVVGQATELLLPTNAEPTARSLEHDHSIHPSDDISSSDYEGSIASTPEIKKRSLLSPGHYLASSGSALERSLALLSTPQSLQRSSGGSLSPKVRQVLGKEVDNDLELPAPGPCTLSESEWMRRTPSPSHFGLPPSQSSKIWSPRPSRKSGGSFFGSLGRIRSRSRSPDKAVRMETHRQDSSPLVGRHAFEEQGNWI